MSTLTIPVLDHGFIILRNVAGPTRRVDQAFDADDIDPANSARMSFDQMDTGRLREHDLKLADYLMKHWHTTPFEMIDIWLEMKLPIFIARQFVRHRTTSIAEVSGRYITLPAEWYIPKVVGGKAKNKKQGQETNLPKWKQLLFKAALQAHSFIGYKLYQLFIWLGVAPEHARILLGLNHYTHWLWKQDAHNMMHFLSLRDHSHAQIEAQQYAQAIYKALNEHLPETMKLYEKYRTFK